MRHLPSARSSGAKGSLSGASRLMAAVEALRHMDGLDMGPCFALRMICSPRFPAYWWLDARNGPGRVGSSREQRVWHSTGLERNLRPGRSVPEASRDYHLGQNPRPAQPAAIQELLSKNDLPRERCFVTRIIPRSPGRQLCRRGITRQKLPCTPPKWPRAGTLTSWMQVDLHGVTFGRRPG
jgi:hypothetical protein